MSDGRELGAFYANAQDACTYLGKAVDEGLKAKTKMMKAASTAHGARGAVLTAIGEIDVALEADWALRNTISAHADNIKAADGALALALDPSNPMAQKLNSAGGFNAEEIAMAFSEWAIDAALRGDLKEFDMATNALIALYDELTGGSSAKGYLENARNDLLMKDDRTENQIRAALLRACMNIMGIEKQEPNFSISDSPPNKNNTGRLNRLEGLMYAWEFEENPNRGQYVYLNDKYSGASDCANFVSRVLCQMGFPMWENGDREKTGWYYTPEESSSSWRGADSLYRSIVGADTKYKLYPESPYHESHQTIYKSGERNAYDYQIMDLVFVRYTDDQYNYGHVMVVVGTDGDNNPIFAHQSSGDTWVPGISLNQLIDRQGQPGIKEIAEMTVVSFENP